MKKWIIRLTFGILAMVLVAVIAFVVYAQFDYEPSDKLTAEVAMEQLETDGQGLYFQPESPNGKGLILYQGAKVEKEAYAYLGKRLSEKGYAVAIPQLPLNFGILGAGKAGEGINEHPEVPSWFLGGHSLGGVAAAMYAEDPSEKLAGLYFLGSYPGSDLSGSRLPLLSIYAERDGLTTLEDVEASKKLLPADSEFVEISGGNHAQFGLYGKQKGDNDASIGPLEQQNQVVDALASWMNNH
ncbi:alpha/beta hydrolase [Planococcus sp. YIM B11945]|uniref:alpha/beta hydrolase n=1 Tax=Planococcus sp. YIM B11945 TaxID=3435410 RepID=UPI003D7E9527